jgi:D-alanine-D-alanine ligase-like ATP-grasp enzyme
MFTAAEALTRSRTAYVGPGYDVIARCFDKYEASRIAVRHGATAPETVLGTAAAGMTLPAVLKLRRGSDSLGLRVIRRGRIPKSKQTEEFIVQQHVRGSDLTVAVLQGRAGAALRICLPEGVPYSFWRKYLLRPCRVPITDAKLAQHVRAEALRIATVLGVDWAARVDFIHETATDRLYFLECDVAPLVGQGSAFELSLTGAGIGRLEQLDLLFGGQ